MSIDDLSEEWLEFFISQQQTINSQQETINRLKAELNQVSIITESQPLAAKPSQQKKRGRPKKNRGLLALFNLAYPKIKKPPGRHHNMPDHLVPIAYQRVQLLVEIWRHEGNKKAGLPQAVAYMLDEIAKSPLRVVELDIGADWKLTIAKRKWTITLKEYRRKQGR